MSTKNARRVEVPKLVRDEIVECAARSQHSVAFLISNMLRSSSVSAPVAGERATLEIVPQDDDPPNIVSHIKHAQGDGKLDERVNGTWAATREKMFAWAAQQERATWADAVMVLDRSLLEAQDTDTSSERLAELALSPYPTVRVLVAKNSQTSEATRAKLKTDGQKAVRLAAGGE